MATAIWRASRPLNELLFERYGAFNVFQLLRLLQWKERKQAHRAGQRDEDERQVRFRADLSAAFPGREVTGLRRIPAEQPDPEPHFQRGPGHEVVEVNTPNFCVAAELGPLPEPYLDWLRDLKRLREHAMGDFFDLFNQRINALRYELKASQCPGLGHAAPEDTPQAFYLACLMGLGQPELDLARAMPLPERTCLGLAGLLSNQRRSSAAVRRVLQLFLETEVRIEELIGAWQPLEEDDQNALGRANHALGAGAVLGRRVWAQQARIRVVVAPLPFERFVHLLPGAEGHARLEALVRLLLDRLCDCEVRLQVNWDSVPPARLSSKDRDRRHGLRLGQTAWLKRRPHGAPHRTAVTYVVPAFAGTGAAANHDREAA